MLNYKIRLQVTTDHHGFSIIVVMLLLSGDAMKTFRCIDDEITVCDVNHTLGSSTTYIIIHKLPVDWVYNQNTEDGKYLLPWDQDIMPISLNTV